MPRILIVEDSAPNRELLYEILKDMARCDFAEDGPAAAYVFNQALESKDFYDVILLDIGLPQVSGMSFLYKVRETEQQAGIPLGEGVPIIMVTAQENRFLEAYEKGCTEYLVKPIDPDLLREKVRKYIY